MTHYFKLKEADYAPRVFVFPGGGNIGFSVFAKTGRRGFKWERGEMDNKVRITRNVAEQIVSRKILRANRLHQPTNNVADQIVSKILRANR